MARVVTLMTMMRGIPYWDRPWPDSWNTLVPARQGRGVRCPSPVDPGAEGSPEIAAVHSPDPERPYARRDHLPGVQRFHAGVRGHAGHQPLARGGVPARRLH